MFTNSRGRHITLVTGNEGKRREFSELIGREIANKNIDLPEVQEINVGEVTRSKLAAAVAMDPDSLPLMIEDTGLYFDSYRLDGVLTPYTTSFPGALVKWYTKALSPEAICGLHGGSTACAVCVIGYSDGQSTMLFRGTILGKVAIAPSGENGFGWDKIFAPDGFGGRTFADLTAAEKNTVSMRAIAVRDLLKYLNS